MEQDNRHDPKVMWQNVETWIVNQDAKFDELMALYPDAESRAMIIKELGEAITDLVLRYYQPEITGDVVTLKREEYRDLLEHARRLQSLEELSALDQKLGLDRD